MPARAVNDEQRVGGLVLPILAVTMFLMTLDTSVMNVSISALVSDLNTSVTRIQGVITAYTLVMAAFMITGGKLGDLMGRRRAFRVGLIVYALGSGITSISPNVFVLLIGWSILEGLGACLIMPTVTALIAGTFIGKQRAVAYGTMAAASAVAVAVGPIIGGYVTTEFSWRWVFAAEVMIALGIVVGSRVLVDVPPDGETHLDVWGALMSAVGLGLVVFGVLQASVWGWVQPKIPSGDNATPTLFGLSVVVWLIAGGLFLLWCFIGWQRRVAARGGTPLIDPELFGNRQLNSGLTALMLQYLIMMGMFFTMPLFLSIVLGLSAFDTGLRMVPLSLALVIVAPMVPRVFPRASPRRVVQIGLLCMLVAALYLAARFQAGADVGITTVPFLLMGAGMGAMASQLGNVIVSAVPVARGGEAGGLQYTAQNLGSSLGTALIGGVVIAALGVFLLQGVQQSSELDAAVKQQAQTQIASGVSFVSDAQLQDALAQTSLSADDQAEIMKINTEARLDALRRAMVAVALFVLLALFMSTRLPGEALAVEAEAEVEAVSASP